MTKWYGIKRDGTKIMQTHEHLLEWARQHGLEKEVENAVHFVTPEGTRIVRGDLNKMLQTAIKLGWDDIAEALFINSQL